MMWKRTLENREHQSMLHSLLEYPSIVIKMNVYSCLCKGTADYMSEMFAFGSSVKEADSFIYLGSVVDRQGGTDHDKSRIGKARVASTLLKNIWTSKNISRTTKLRIFNSNVKSILLYKAETWRTTKIAY
jgi:hypothetical protein